MQLYQEDIDAWLAKSGDADATNLAELHCAKELKELAAAARAFDRAFRKIQQTFPDAEIYSPNDGLILMLGATHDSTGSHEKKRQDRRAEIRNWPCMNYISGGDW